MGCHVLRNPAGTFSFVGDVPMALAYKRRDGTPMDDQLARNISRAGPGLYRDIVKSCTWPTEDAARAEAARLGVALAN